MKVKLIINMDTKTGQYKINFGKVSESKEDIDYSELMTMLYKILLDLDNTIKDKPEDRTLH